MRITERRLKQIIKEEAGAYLLVESFKLELLNEGFIKFLKKQFGDTDYENLLDSLEGSLNKPALSKMPRTKRILTLALAGFMAAGTTQFLTDYLDVSSQAELQAAQRVGNSFERMQDKIQSVQNFRDLTTSEAGVDSNKDMNQHLDDMRVRHIGKFKVAPMATNVMFIDGDPEKRAKGFVFVPYDEIPDDQVLPVAGMTKHDYETFLRMAWLAGDSKGDDRLKGYVYGTGKAGSSIFWSYENSLYSPIVDYTGSSEDVRSKMLQHYGEGAGLYMMLPLEWSVAHHLAQTRSDLER
jgi:hypothetical protein